jgi:BirA family biotin operon repressor/biotin-[acetyl-CoA-carboxylase] ligase
VGVNVSMAQGEVRRRAADASIDRSWTDMESQIPHHANGVSRNEVAALLLEELLAGVLEYQSTGFGALRAEWTELDLLAGKEVRLDLQGKFTDGIARGISEDGALLLDVTGPDGRVERQVIHAGEVSVHRD